MACGVLFLSCAKGGVRMQVVLATDEFGAYIVFHTSCMTSDCDNYNGADSNNKIFYTRNDTKHQYQH